ncbi:MAG: histidine kinase [Acidimicrobiales bacterium]|jgi:signal transduction histidine kinase
MTTIENTSVSVPSLGDSRPARLLPAAALLSLVTIAIGVLGLQAHVRGGLSAVDGVALALVFAWSLAGLVEARFADRTPAWLVLAGTLAAAVALSANRLADSQHAISGHETAARVAATLVGMLIIAVMFHVLLALPDGRLRSGGRRAGAAFGYVAALATGVVFVVRDRPFPVLAGALCWIVAALCALPATRRRYATSIGPDRERLQWIGIGSVLAADVALVAGVLHLLVDWPGPLAAVAAAATVLIPVGVMVGHLPRLAPKGGRVFVHVLSIVGFTMVVSAIYLVIVLGLGHAPKDTEDRKALGLSMLAAAVAAVGYVPAQRRLLGSATRFVYGSRQAPDEVLRTFGSRLTRAVAMDELLLQMAESLRKTMALTSAEVYTGVGDVLERAVSVPDSGPGTVVVSARERPVITRAGVSGSAWASVWIPDLLNGRPHAQLRVAPISHAGELLGLIVIERPQRSDAFSEDDDRVLTELARQVGLAFHNVQLDAALQTTLDEVRKQADELRESRARIVASSDAERRRMERDLHDGAQQHLVALAVNIRLVRDIMADDPAAGAEILDQLASDVQDTIHELRELAHGIYPPLLVDSGLVEALRAAANRSPLDVEVVAEGIGRYSSELEAAVYFCCLEALQNAAKHAPKASVEVRLWEESGGLLFSVSDDGPGVDMADATHGHGLVNMTDRLGAIGGTVRWESQPGQGLQVRGSVPVG